MCGYNEWAVIIIIMNVDLAEDGCIGLVKDFTSATIICALDDVVM